MNMMRMKLRSAHRRYSLIIDGLAYLEDVEESWMQILGIHEFEH